MLKTNCCHIISGITTLYLIQFVILFILSQRRCCPLYLWNSVMLKKTHWCVVIGLWFFLFPFYAEYFVVAANSKNEWCRIKPVFLFWLRIRSIQLLLLPQDSTTKIAYIWKKRSTAYKPFWITFSIFVHSNQQDLQTLPLFRNIQVYSDIRNLEIFS